MKGQDAIEKMRRNFKTLDRFTKAFHERFDGLRIVQFLRFRGQQLGAPHKEEQLNQLLKRIGKPQETLKLDTDHIPQLDALRQRLFHYESEFQADFMAKWRTEVTW